MRREPKVVLVLLGWHSGNSRAAAYCPTRKLSATNTRLCRASVGGVIGWQTDDGTKVCGCEKQETRGRVVSARTPTRAPSIVSWSTRARSLFSSLRTRWRTSGFSHRAPSPPSWRRANGTVAAAAVPPRAGRRPRLARTGAHRSRAGPGRSSNSALRPSGCWSLTRSAFAWSSSGMSGEPRTSCWPYPPGPRLNTGRRRAGALRALASALPSRTVGGQRLQHRIGAGRVMFVVRTVAPPTPTAPVEGARTAYSARAPATGNH